MSWLAALVLVTTVQLTLVVGQDRRDAPWGELRYSEQSNETIFVVKVKKRTECIFLHAFGIDDAVDVLIDDEILRNEFQRVCNKAEMKVEYRKAEGKLAASFYRIFDVGEYPVEVINTISRCNKQRSCDHQRKETEASAFILLTSPIARQQAMKTINFTHKMILGNDTIALLHLDPDRIGLLDTDFLEFHECDKDDILFSMNSTSLTRRTVFKHFGPDLCVKYVSNRAPGISNFVIPAQLVQLFLSDREGESRTAYFNVERRVEPSVDLLILKGDPQIYEPSSSYLCHFAQLEISDADDNLLLISKTPDLRSNISLEVSRTDGEDDIYVTIKSFDIYAAVFQNIVWKSQLPSNKSLSTYVANIGCDQRGDPVKSADDRYNSGAVFCVYVKTGTLKRSDDSEGRNLWTEIKEKIKEYIFNIANNASFVERTAIPIKSMAQIDIPTNNPVVYATRDRALVRLAFVITKEDRNIPALNQEYHYQILEEFEHVYREGESFTLAPYCHVEISLVRNLIFFGLLVLICTVIFGAIWRCQLNTDLQRRVIAQINEGKRRKSETDWWDSGTSEIVEENSPPDSQEHYVNQAFIAEADAQVNDQVIRSKLKGTSLAMKSFRRNDLANRRMGSGGLPLSVPGGMGGQMSQIREEDETTSTSRI